MSFAVLVVAVRGVRIYSLSTEVDVKPFKHMDFLDVMVSWHKGFLESLVSATEGYHLHEMFEEDSF